jgi:hypothetical protein
VAKNQTGNATNDSKNLVNQAQGLTAPILSGFEADRGTAQQNQATELGLATGGYQQQQVTGGYNPDQLGTLRANTAGLAANGGYDPNGLSTIRSAAAGDAATGGYDPTSLGALSNAYTDMYNTGGYTPAEGQAYVRQATSGVASTGDILANKLQQDKAKTGGLGTGGDASQMARQLEQTQSQATLAAETGLKTQENSNKFSALSGGSTLAGNVAAGKTAGVGQQIGIENNLAAGKSAGVGAQIGLESGVAQGSNQANAGLASLYNTTTGQITALGNQMLQTLGLNFSTQAEAIGALTKLSQNPGAFQTVFSDVVEAGGAAVGAYSGLGLAK